jgi:hypothetical protein
VKWNELARPLQNEDILLEKRMNLPMRVLKLLPLLLFGFWGSLVAQTTYYSNGGDWNQSTSWSTVAFGNGTNAGPAPSYPVAGDIVNIGGGFTITVTGNEACGSITFSSLTNNTLVIDGTNSLTVSGNLVGGGAVQTQISYTGGGLLRVGGTMFVPASGTINTVTGSRFEYIGTTQTVTALAYNDLILSGSGVKTLGATTTVGRNLTINATAFNVSGQSLTVNGTTTVNSGGSINFVTSATGTKLFTGLVTINSGGTWNNAINEGFTFQGGITNNGSGNWTGGTAGTYLFNTNTQTITGEVNAPTVTVTGGAIDLINNGTLTASVALGGTGEIVQGAGATLTLGGTSTITGFTVTASGNTVNYTGAAQTVRAVNYQNLSLSGSGAKTLAVGTANIAGNFTIGGTATANAVVGLTIGGNVALNGGTFTGGAFTHTVGGNWLTNGGVFAAAGSTLVFNRAGGQTIGGSAASNFDNVTLAGSGTKAFAQELDATGNLLINSGVVADLGALTSHSANRLRLGGVSVPSGIWGSVASPANPPNESDIFFTSSSPGTIAIAAGGFTYYARASTDWNIATTWSTVDHSSTTNDGTFPTASDEVVIGGGFSVTVTGAESASQVSFSQTAALANQLIIGGTNSLVVSGTITLPRNGNSNTLAVGAGSVTAGNVTFTTGNGSGVHQVTLTTGTLVVSGNVTGIGNSSAITYAGSGLVQVGGTMFAAGSGLLTTVEDARFEYTGGSQTVQALGYEDLILSGSGTKTLAATTTLNGNLTINTTTFNVAGVSLSVAEGTTVNTGGTLAFVTSAAGTKTFTGLVTVNTGGTWNNVVNEGFTFQGGITNNGGTWNGGTAGTYLFNTTQTISGIVNTPTLTVTGATVDLNNNGTLTATVALSGTGEIVQGSGATLNLGGTSTITTFTVSAAGNTVHYTGAAQTVRAVNYRNLGLSGSGIKTLGVGTTNISGNLIMSGTASATAVVGLIVSGDFTLGTGTTFTAGNFTHRVGGNWANNGATFNNAGSTIVFDGTAQTIGGTSSPLSFENLTFSGTGAKTFSQVTNVALTLSVNTGATAGLGGFNHTANALRLGGGPVPSGSWGGTGSGATFENATFFVSGAGIVTVATGAFTFYSTDNGNWNSTSTWSTVGHDSDVNLAGTFPGLTDEVFLGGGFTVTVTANQPCGAVSFDATAATTNQLIINSGVTLTVTNAVTIPRNGGSNTLAVGAGILTAGSLDFPTGTGAGVQQLTLSTGTVTVSGNVIGSGTSSTIAYSGNGVFQVGGAMFASGSGTLSTVAGSRFEYNGVAQTIQALSYRDLILSGSGIKTFTTTATVVSGALSVNAVTVNVPGLSLTVSGTTTVNSGGTLAFVTSAAGTKLFTGLVTINSGGTWNNVINEGFTFQGGITNNGTFTAGTAGTYLFNTSSQPLTGTFILPSVTVTGAAVALTNNNTLTVNTALAGTGRITQAAGATLNVAGTSTIANMTATATGNTVNFSAASGTQNINNVNFFNLVLSGGGTKSFQTGTTTISGNFTLSGTAVATAAAGLSILGTVTLGNGTTFTGGAFNHNVAGDWINNGATFNNTSSAITLNGTAPQAIGGSATTAFNDLTLSGAGAKTFGVLTVIGATLTINTGAVANFVPTLTHSASVLVLAGVTQLTGTWGATGSGAANLNDTFFSGPGLVQVGFDVFYLRQTGVWNDFNSWSDTGHAGPVNPANAVPGVDDVAVIGGNFTVTVSTAETVSNLIFDQTTGSTNTVTINGGASLSVLSSVSIPQNNISGANVLNVGAGTLTTANINFTNDAGVGAHSVTIGSGTAVVTGSINGVEAASTVTVASGGTLRLGGAIFTPTLGTLTASSGSFVEYDGVDQTIQPHTYNGQLRLTGSGTKSLAANTTVAGSLFVGDNATFSVTGFDLVVSGTTTVGTGTGGSIIFQTSATGTKTFGGLVTISANASWSNPIAEGIFIQNGITNNGNFSSGTGIYTFNTNAQALTGTFVLQTVTITGINLTNTNTLTVNGVLGGTGTITQGTNAVLNISFSSVSVTGFNATATGNTVNYTGATQTVRGGNYFNLILSGSGTKTLNAGTTAIAGNFTVSGSVTTTAVTGLTIGGSVSLGGTSFTAGNFTHSVAGDWNLVSGSFVSTGSTINFNGTALQTISPAQNFNNLSINNSSLAGVVSASNQTVNGAFTNNGRLTVPGLFLNGDVTLGASSTTNVPVFSITGGVDQNFSANGLTLGDIDVIKSGGDLILTTPLNLEGVLSIQSATTVASGAGNLRVLSTADDPVQDGAIGPIAAGGNITGTVTVNRFMGAEGTVNRYISSPVVGATVSQLSDDFAISPNAIRFYNESVVGAANLGYVTVNGTHVMENGRGYLAYMWNGVLDRPWDVSGTVAVGPVNLPVTHTPSSPVQINADGWNLVGNPYPCGIVWDDGPGWTRSAGIGELISVPDIGGPVTELNWNYTDNTGDLPNGLIAMGQAFWVYSDNSAPPVLQVNEAAKTTTLSGSFFRNRQVASSEQLIVRLIPEGGKEDRAFLKLNARGSDGWDAGLDAYKRPQDDYSSVSLLDQDGRALVMHTLSKRVLNITVPLSLDFLQPGRFTLNVDRAAFLSFDKVLWLVDTEAGEYVAMDESFTGYSFDVPRAGRNNQRFIITSNAEVAEQLATALAVFPNPAADYIVVKHPGTLTRVELIDARGAVVKSATVRAGEPISVSDLAPGVYVVRVRTAEGLVTKRIIKQ